MDLFVAWTETYWKDPLMSFMSLICMLWTLFYKVVFCSASCIFPRPVRTLLEVNQEGNFKHVSRLSSFLLIPFVNSADN